MQDTKQKETQATQRKKTIERGSLLQNKNKMDEAEHFLLNVNLKVERKEQARQTVLVSGGHSECEPPDPIPNSEVKPLCADDSVE